MGSPPVSLPAQGLTVPGLSWCPRHPDRIAVSCVLCLWSPEWGCSGGPHLYPVPSLGLLGSRCEETPLNGGSLGWAGVA